MKNFQINKKFLFGIYFLIQCPTLLVNFLIFILSIIYIGLKIFLGLSSIDTENLSVIIYSIYVIVFISTYFIYFLITVISVFSTYKLYKNKTLNKIEKISIISYAIITIPLYIVLIYKNPLLLLFS